MDKIKSVEINVTFYRLLKKEAFDRWYKETPPGFTFCLKGSRFISHVKKLKDVELPLSTFFNATAPLLEKLDVILWQLPPNLKLNMKNLEDFIENLKKYNVRHVFEFRHKSWLTKKVYNLLSDANIALCLSDWPPFLNDLPITANFVYIRRHGEGGSYASNYSTEELRKDAKKIKEYLKLGKDVYYYFNNDAFAYAPKNAIELKTILDNTLPISLRREEKPVIKPLKVKPLKKKTSLAAVKKAALKKAIAATKKKTAAASVNKAAPKEAVTAARGETASAAIKKAVKKLADKKRNMKASKKTAAKAVKKTASKAPVKKTVKKTAAKKSKKILKKTTKTTAKKK